MRLNIANKNLSKIQIGIEILLTLVMPMVVMPFLIYQLVKKSNKYYIVLLALSFAMLALQWKNPPENFDIYRHYESLDYIRKNPISKTISWGFTLISPLQYWIMLFVAPLNNNYILPFIVVFLTMYLFISILVDIFPSDEKSKCVLILLLLSSIRILELFSGMWNIFAIAVLSYGLLIKSNRKSRFLFYVVSVGLHFSMIIPMFFILIAEINQNHLFLTKRRIVVLVLILILSPILILPLVQVSYDLTGLIIFKRVLTRFSAYVLNPSQFGNLRNTSYIIVEMSKVILVVWCYYVYQFRYVKKNHKIIRKNSIEMDNVVTVVTYSLVILLVLLGVYLSILLRFTLLVMVLFLGSSQNIVHNIRENQSQSVLRLSRLLLVGVISLQSVYQIYALYNAGILFII